MIYIIWVKKINEHYDSCSENILYILKRFVYIIFFQSKIGWNKSIFLRIVAKPVFNLYDVFEVFNFWYKNNMK